MNGKLLRLSLAKDDRYRLYEPLDKISKKVIDATVLYEDQSFYSHNGVDIIALFRAFWISYVTKQRRVGASTITMQLARMRWNIKSNTLGGKIYQLVRAIQISRHYSKQEVLEAYLNSTPYGGNVVGVGAASRIYFDKNASDLNVIEALTLAVIPQNPNKRNPINKKGFDHLRLARSFLFDRWKAHYPDDGDVEKFMDMKLFIRSPKNLPFEAPHFINLLQAQYSEWDSGTVNTSIDLKWQHKIENIVSNYVSEKERLGINNATALLLNHQTMSVEAMVGSADFFNASIYGQVNGVSAKRSPGSTLKPFVYALAMDQGLIHPLSLMKDLPKKFGGFTPENYDKKFRGPLSVKNALIESRNVPAVNIQAKLQGQSFYDFLTHAGVSDLKEAQHYGLALALGGGELSAIELARLYAILANGGELKPISYISKATDIETKSPPTQRLLSKEASFLTLDILRENPAPDNFDVDFTLSAINDIAWKTGTSWAFRDAWAVGVSGPYVLVVWVGHFDGRGNDAFVGRTAAGPLFFRILESTHPPQNWRVTDLFDMSELNLKRLDVCSNTGDLFEKHCPITEKSWFIPGVSPIKLSNIYREVPVNPITGKRACIHQPGTTELHVFEFWPSELLQVYASAGLSLKTPPEYEAPCSMDVTSATGQDPEIISPQSSIDYVFRMNDASGLSIPLAANVDAGVNKLHWFINASYMESTSPLETPLWHAKPGRYEIKVVDDSGRSATTYVNVVSSHR